MYHIPTPEGVTVISRGIPYTVANDHGRYDELITAINAEDDDAVYTIVTASDEIAAILATFGEVSVFGGHVTYKGEELHNYLVQRLLDTVRNGGNAAPLGRFLERVLENPSYRAVNDLYAWCEKAKMPLTSDGCIIAYKIVNSDFTDCYTSKFDNSPGKTVEVPRSAVDDNPDITCSRGLHFCSAEYLPNYGPSNKKVVLVKVSPADVVAFPKDYNLSKARCCKYEVLEEIDAATAATFFNDFTAEYYDVDDEDFDFDDVDDESATVVERIERIEQHLALNDAGTIVARIDAINMALGFDEVEPLIANLDRAERQLGLS
jgi:hypothetical protein